jgi:hypothetical protein
MTLSCSGLQKGGSPPREIHVTAYPPRGQVAVAANHYTAHLYGLASAAVGVTVLDTYSHTYVSCVYRAVSI